MANDPRFETYPEMQRFVGGKIEHPRFGLVDAPNRDEPTGQFGWRFRDANGRITFVGGEAFTRRADTHRAIEGACDDVLAALAVAFGIQTASRGPIPIVDLGEDGEPL